MNSEKLVTAVIITHNRVELLKKAVQSVLDQTYPDIELIVVDDASIDETKEVFEKISKEKGFQYIYIPKEESKGGNHARNVGIQAGNGEYVAFLDDDDEWLPEKIEKQVALLNQYPECGVCHCGKIYDHNYGEKQRIQDTSKLLEGDLSKIIFYSFVCLSSTMMIRRNLLDEVGCFDEYLRFWQDYELCIRLFQKTKVAVVREPLVLFRVNPSDKNRLTNKIEGWELATDYIYKKYADEIEKLSDDELKKTSILYYRDGAMRCRNCGEFEQQKQYLKKLYLTTHKLEDFINMLMNIYSVRELLREWKESIKNITTKIARGGVNNEEVLSECLINLNNTYTRVYYFCRSEHYRNKAGCAA